MEDIIKTLKDAPDFIGGTGRTEAEIESAEKELGINFASDYKTYLKEIGLACFDGHELTGICEDLRLDVVHVTKDQWENNPEAKNYYVIEEANIDGIVIWQDFSGKIYMTEGNLELKLIADSLIDYIKKYS
ncbi:SMI1/KNR4 family protein [Anaerococcus murdochii]|uniref:SMI1/KNR4 family protein n=1 Tax=Anaerococcus murdochii TaxID=411577 RepID=A0ABS7SYE9_9FIRM|nr:SMI1/KNR4 family protein [Anaerococcus murdochii]MBZ2386566.1 SMI1/KNR4 family protein [Anaerococcus murdochii]